MKYLVIYEKSAPPAGVYMFPTCRAVAAAAKTLDEAKDLIPVKLLNSISKACREHGDPQIPSPSATTEYISV